MEGSSKYGKDCDEPAISLVQKQFLRHSDLIRGFIRSLLADCSMADDVLQETFLTVTQKAGDFQAGTSFPRWACAIARYKVLEARRAMRRSEPGLSEEVIEALAVSEEAFNPDPRVEHLKKCLEGLSPSMRRVIGLRYWGDHSAPEIAERIKWKTEAVYVALSRARKLLRDCLAKKPGPNANWNASC